MHYRISSGTVVSGSFRPNRPKLLLRASHLFKNGCLVPQAQTGLARAKSKKCVVGPIFSKRPRTVGGFRFKNYRQDLIVDKTCLEQTEGLRCISNKLCGAELSSNCERLMNSSTMSCVSQCLEKTKRRNNGYQKSRCALF
jgi:hypothetical protein